MIPDSNEASWDLKKKVPYGAGAVLLFSELIRYCGHRTFRPKPIDVAKFTALTWDSI